MARRHWKVQCSSKSKRSGEQCRNFCGPGHTVCHIHGAEAPQTILAAKVRLKLLEVWNVTADTIDNPYDAVLTVLSHLVAREAELNRRLGEIGEGDIDTPALVAWQRVATETAKAGMDLCKLDLDERRVRLSALQVEQAGRHLQTAWAHKINELKQALPSEYHHLLEMKASHYFRQAALEQGIPHPTQQEQSTPT